MRLSDLVGGDDCFVTRVWGFSPETWGAMGFPKAGAATKWLRDGVDRRVVCFVSHHAADHIAESDRGRVLGIYELAPELVELENDDVLDATHLVDPAMRHEDRRFRWPVGLRARRAWRFSPVVPRTSETLPDARRMGQDVSTDLVRLSPRDYDLLNQSSYRLKEVPVYGVEWNPSRIADPVAVPCHLYVFATAKKDVLSRLPGWRPGEILIKIGCTSDVEGRLASFNEDPIARIFRFRMAKVASRYVGETDARPLEAELLNWATSSGRPAADISTEFFFISEGALLVLQKRLATILRVA